MRTELEVCSPQEVVVFTSTELQAALDKSILYCSCVCQHRPRVRVTVSHESHRRAIELSPHPVVVKPFFCVDLCKCNNAQYGSRCFYARFGVVSIKQGRIGRALSRPPCLLQDDISEPVLLYKDPFVGQTDFRSCQDIFVHSVTGLCKIKTWHSADRSSNKISLEINRPSSLCSMCDTPQVKVRRDL